MEIQEAKKLVEKAIELLHKKDIPIRLLSIKEAEVSQYHQYFDVRVAWGNGDTTDFNVGDLDNAQEARRFPMLKSTADMIPLKKNTNLTDFDYVALCLAGWLYAIGKTRNYF